jgi:hypothetical protein
MMRTLVLALLLSLGAVAEAATVYRTVKTARPGYYTAVTRYPRFTERTPVTRLANAAIAREARGAQAAFVKAARKAQAGTGRPHAPYEHRTEAKVSYFYAPRLVSVTFDTLEYTGGAHPISPYWVLNFGLIDGRAKQLVLGDLFRSGSDYRGRVTELVLRKLKAKEGATWVIDGSVKSLSTEQLNRFAVRPDGLTFLINQYEAGPYVAGRFEIPLTLAELGPDFRRSLIVGR